MEQAQKSKVVGVRVPYPLYEKLEVARKEERRTKSNMIVILIEEALRVRQEVRQAQAQ